MVSPDFSLCDMPLDVCKALLPPVVWCSVPLHDVIAHGGRLDVKTYNIEARHAHEAVMHGKYPAIPLSGEGGLIKSAYYPGRFKRIYGGRERGTAFYSASQINEINPRAEKYILKATRCNTEKLRLRAKTLLLTRSGTVGNAACVGKTLEGRVFSDDVIRIIFKEDYDLGYVYTYLKSKIGGLILLTSSFGLVVTHIEPAHLAKVIIPDAPREVRERINDKIMKSYAARDESNALMDEAERLLIDALKLPPVEDFFKYKGGINAFSIKMSALEDRFDVQYHLHGHSALIRHLQENAREVTTIGNSRISSDVVLPGRFKRAYVEEKRGKIFIGGKQITSLDPANKKYLSMRLHERRIINRYALHENMVLVTRSGTLGKVALVGKQWEGWVASEHVIRIIPASKDIAGYLAVFLMSDCGKRLLARYSYGTTVDEVDDEHVRSVPFPLLKDSTVQRCINDMALKASEKRYEAYTLEKDAIGIMEDEVIGNV